MGMMVYSLLWVMQDFVHQPYIVKSPPQKQKCCKALHKARLWRRRGGSGIGRPGLISCVLRGSWDLVTGVIIKVTILIITYNPT